MMMIMAVFSYLISLRASALSDLVFFTTMMMMISHFERAAVHISFTYLILDCLSWFLFIHYA